MKATLIATSAALALAAVPGSVEHKFEQFMITYKKTYSGAERDARFAIFSDNISKMNKLSIENPSVVFDINQFSDMTMVERNNIMHTGFRAQLPAGIDGAELVGPASLKEDFKTIDYSDCYTYVRDQDQCGSCWAFATAAAVQGAHCKSNGFNGDLAPQALVDCDTKQAGCNGAYDLVEPFQHVQKNGIPFEKDYIYTHKDGVCKTTDDMKKVYLHKVFDFSGKSADDVIKALDTYGPLSVGVAVGFEFQSYKTGVLTKTSCGRAPLNHAVTLIKAEYDEELKEPVFTIRNSWGGRWGESGNIRLTWGACQLGAMAVAAEAGDAPKVLSRRF